MMRRTIPRAGNPGLYKTKKASWLAVSTQLLVLLLGYRCNVTRCPKLLPVTSLSQRNKPFLPLASPIEEFITASGKETKGLHKF